MHKFSVNRFVVQPWGGFYAPAIVQNYKMTNVLHSMLMNNKRLDATRTLNINDDKKSNRTSELFGAE